MIDEFRQSALKSRQAVLVGLRGISQSQAVLDAQLSELALLAHTNDICPVARFSQVRAKPHPQFFLGKGKVDELSAYMESLIDKDKETLLIFDDELSPFQLRNLERRLKCHIYDRSLLILEIFLSGARTAEARFQVEMARYEYLLPRLTRRWTHLERQRGGLSSRGGAGEKEIETDKRQIRDRMVRLRRRLARLATQRHNQQKQRHAFPRLALVGYTNAGKSTLMDALTTHERRAKNQLFTTLDTTVRRCYVAGTHCLLSDTVGFIDKLPHTLIESFHSTLDEARHADLLIVVGDVSDPQLEKQLSVVRETLDQIGILGKPTLLVLNKADALDLPAEEERFAHFLDLYTDYHIGSAYCAKDLRLLKQRMGRWISLLPNAQHKSLGVGKNGTAAQKKDWAPPL